MIAAASRLARHKPAEIARQHRCIEHRSSYGHATSQRTAAMAACASWERWPPWRAASRLSRARSRPAWRRRASASPNAWLAVGRDDGGRIGQQAVQVVVEHRERSLALDGAPRPAPRVCSCPPRSSPGGRRAPERGSLLLDVAAAAAHTPWRRPPPCARRGRRLELDHGREDAQPRVPTCPRVRARQRGSGLEHHERCAPARRARAANPDCTRISGRSCRRRPKANARE